MTPAQRTRTLKVTLPYTATQANRALPLVERIVGDLVALAPQWEHAVRRAEFPDSHGVSGETEVERWQDKAQRLAAEIEHCIDELVELGVEVRTLDTGLIDFPGTLDGRDVYFCWKLGEPAVAHWHPRDAGFDSRQPLPVDALTPLG